MPHGSVIILQQPHTKLERNPLSLCAKLVTVNKDGKREGKNGKLFYAQ
jgi:hypothetical protein